MLRGQGQNAPTTPVLLHRRRPAQDHPGADRLDPAGPGDLHDRRPRRFPRPGRHDYVRSQRHAGPAQPQLSQRPGPDGDPVLRRTGDAAAVSIPCSAAWATAPTRPISPTRSSTTTRRTPIQSGSAPFFATYNPQKPLSAFAGPERQGNLDARRPELLDDQGHRHVQRLVAELPEAVADHRPGRAGQRQPSASFRIFTLGQTNALSSQAWTPVGPARHCRPARAGSAASSIDPSDPSGNTVYVGGASGGIWKTTNFLTTSPGGPTYIPLTDFGPTSGVNIGSIAVFGRNNNPNQSIIIAATGEGDTGTPRRRLPDLSGRRRDLEPVRQHQQRRFQRQLAADRIDGARPDLRRHDVVQGRRRSPAHSQRPGDHLRRPERHQRRHLAEREHGQDLAADAGRPGDRRGPRPEQRHRPRSDHRHQSRATSRSSTPASAARASS